MNLLSLGYTIQRLYLQNKYRNDTTTAHQLWTSEQLNASVCPLSVLTVVLHKIFPIPCI